MITKHFIYDEKSYPVCLTCGHHQELHVEGKCLFGPTGYRPMPAIDYYAWVKPRGYRRFNRKDEKYGGMRCCTVTCRKFATFFVESLAGARVVTCIRCQIRRGNICVYCGLTTAEHVDGYCISYVDEPNRFTPAKRFDKKLRAVYGYD